MKFDKKIQALWGPQVFFDLLDCQTSVTRKKIEKTLSEQLA